MDEALARSLGFETAEAAPVSFEKALYPSPGVAMGRWNQHLLLLSDPLAETLLSSPEPNSAAREVLSVLGPHRILVATLHSVVDLYGYALFESGTLIRGRTGAADDGPLCWGS